jgi:hypothetical protein
MFFERDTVYLGEDVHLTIRARYLEDMTVSFPAEIEMPDHVDVRVARKEDPVTVSEGIVEESCVYNLTTAIPGTYSVPAVVVSYRDETGDHDYVLPPSKFEIVRTVEDISAVKDLRDIKPPREIERDYTRTLVLAGGAVTGVLLVVYLRRHVLRRRMRRRIEEKPVPPNIQALERLREIERSGLLAGGKPEEFVSSIAGAVRRYVRERFSIPAGEMTTDELADRTEDGHHMADECRELARDFLKKCDSVKFAAHSPSKEECERLFDMAIEFIERSY